MADDIDAATEREEAWQRRAVEAARMGPVHLPGDPECRQCGEDNDRARDGFGVCSDCVEAARQ